MPELIKKISEYFIGTYTNRFHDREKNFYYEFVIDKEKLESLLKLSKISQDMSQCPRITANMLDMMLLYSATNYKMTYLLGIIPVELVRFFYNKKSKREKEIILRRMNEIASEAQKNLSSELSDILDGNRKQ